MSKNEPQYTIEYHRLHPQVSIEEHVKNRTVALGQWVNQRDRIYLDKRFWIILRDVILGRRTDEASCNLLDALRARVFSKQSICPISESIFIELYKQQDSFTRAKTAALIDELSEGVTLSPFPNRVNSELAHFLYDLGGKAELWPIENLVWSKLSYVMGLQHPTQTLCEPSEELVIQKAFFDCMWDFPLAKIVDQIGDATVPPVDYEALATKLNKSNASHAGEIKSFKQAYIAEMTGSLSVFMPTVRQVLEQMFERATGQPVNTTQLERSEHEKKLLLYFHNIIEKDEVAIRLRTLHITSLCHAVYRWDKKRNLKKNDFIDFYHAAAGVGYCDVFLTENPLRAMLQQKHLNISDHFSCRIISSVSEAAELFA